MSDYVVYALADPDDGEWRYVGISRDVRARFAHHLSTARTGREGTAKADWIRKLVNQDKEPAVVIVAEGLDESGAVELEQDLIGGRQGLLNISGGGQCGPRPIDKDARWLRRNLWFHDEIAERIVQLLLKGDASLAAEAVRRARQVYRGNEGSWMDDQLALVYGLGACPPETWRRHGEDVLVGAFRGVTR